MNNETILVKVKERLNKLASADYDNFESWQIVEAFNKAQIEFASRSTSIGERNKKILEGLQVILTEFDLKGTSFGDYFETQVIPDNFLSYKRVSLEGTKEECPDPRPFLTYLVEESDIRILLRDPNSNPSWEWGETLVTMIDNKIRIYTQDKFVVKDPYLVYYRNPRPISIIGVVDMDTKEPANSEVTCEFKKDIIELIITETAGILAGDIENFNQQQRANQEAQKNTLR